LPYVVPNFPQERDGIADVLQHVPRVHEIRIEGGVARPEGIRLDAHVGRESVGATRMADVEAEALVPALSAEGQQELPVAAPHLQDALPTQGVPRDELLGEALREVPKLSRAVQ